MHDAAGQGASFFVCDFCARPWAEDRPMVEGHQGSLICGDCLTVAYAEVIVLCAGLDHDQVLHNCTMCLEHRAEPYWKSPARPEAVVCDRCLRQSAMVLEKDPDSGWRRPESNRGDR